MKTAGWIMWFLGFIAYVVFLNLAYNIGVEAWLYAIGASLSAVIFTNGIYLKQ